MVLAIGRLVPSMSLITGMARPTEWCRPRSNCMVLYVESGG